MTRIVAQGTFDLLHPGHVHYLEEAAALGEELVVIVARRSNVEHKSQPILSARQRRDVVSALGMVDEAILGDDTDIFVPIERLDPDVIVLGYDQHHDEERLRAELADRDIDCNVHRTTARRSEYPEEILSTGDIIDRIRNRFD